MVALDDRIVVYIVEGMYGGEDGFAAGHVEEMEPAVVLELISVVFVGVELVRNLQQNRCAVLAVDVARINVLRISVGCVDARVIEVVVDVVEVDFMPFVAAEGDAVVIGTVYPSPFTGVVI